MGADPIEPIVIIFGTSRDLADIINCAKFHIDRSRGYGVGGGPKIACSHRKAESSITTALHYRACLLFFSRAPLFLFPVHFGR
jgi:hypothetical protein